MLTKRHEPGPARPVGRLYAHVRCLVFKKQGADLIVFICLHVAGPAEWTKNEETTANRSRESQVLTADALVVLGFSVWSRLWKITTGSNRSYNPARKADQL
jgi:hypothetical protein